MTDELGPAGQGPFAPRVRARRCESIAEAHRRAGNGAAAAEWQGLANGWTAFAERQEAREASMKRECRYCKHMNEWNAERCGGCQRERWNDPDDTKLGRDLGELERQDPAVARAAAKLDRMVRR